MRFLLKLVAKHREKKRRVAEDLAKAKAQRTEQIAKHLADATRAVANIGCTPIAWKNADEKATTGSFYFFRDKKLYAAKVTHGGGLTIHPI